MKLSVAAVPYFWSKQNYQTFYQKLAEMPVDIVYLGETVCSKRRSMKLEDWIEIGNRLTDAGKQVVLSTLTLLEAESELSALTKIAKQKDFLVEANDVAAIQVASQNENPFVAGSPINLYNNHALKRYHDLGMKRWCIPVELGRDDLAPMIELAKSLGIELEYQVFGRMQLATSARCFTARHHHLAKDDCQFKCMLDEQGILVKTQEGQSFAQINGIQTQSAKVTHLLNQWRELDQFGIDILRIVPVGLEDTLNVVQQTCQMIRSESQIFSPELLESQYEFCNGYWYQIEGMKYVS